MNNQKHNRHERRRKRTREQLKQATMELLMEKGYDAISIQDITDRADLGRGTFYIHFKDKEEAVWAIIQDEIETTTRQAYQQFGGVVPAQAEYYGYVNIFRHAELHRNLYRVILGSLGSALLTSRVQDYMAADFLRDMQQVRQLYTDLDLPQEVLAQIVTGAVVRLALWWLETPNEYTPEQLGAMLYKALHHQVPPRER